MADPETLAVYGARADAYAEISPPSPRLAGFLAQLAPGARILDLGCGPGQDAGAMAAAGFRAEALDASPQMVARAAARPGVTAWQARFEDLDPTPRYDAVWASFSLLHVPAADLPPLLGLIHRALRPGGLFHIGMKTGSGAGRDRLGRFYTYWDPGALAAALTRAGFDVGDMHHGAGAGLAGRVDPFVEIRAHA